MCVCVCTLQHSDLNIRAEVCVLLALMSHTMGNSYSCRTTAPLDVFTSHTTAVTRQESELVGVLKRLIHSSIQDLLQAMGINLPVLGTSDYTGLRTRGVCRGLEPLPSLPPRIEPGSADWQSSWLTTVLPTHT